MSCMRMYLQIHVVIDTLIPVYVSADLRRQQEGARQGREVATPWAPADDNRKQPTTRTATRKNRNHNHNHNRHHHKRRGSEVGQIFSRIPAAMPTTSTMTTTTATTSTTSITATGAALSSNLGLSANIPAGMCFQVLHRYQGIAARTL